jgi:hypothetical protein
MAGFLVADGLGNLIDRYCRSITGFALPVCSILANMARSVGFVSAMKATTF